MYVNTYIMHMWVYILLSKIITHNTIFTVPTLTVCRTVYVPFVMPHSLARSPQLTKHPIPRLYFGLVSRLSRVSNTPPM